MLIALAGWESQQGRTEYGLRLLDRAEDLVPAEYRGLLQGQRGQLLMRNWRGSEALKTLDEAITLLEGNQADHTNLAIALLNRSFAYLNMGDVRRARLDLVRCQRVTAAGGDDLNAAKAVHNLGYCDLLAGDIPAALQRFDAAAGIYRVIAPGNLPVLAMDKARALLAAGLADDAAGELESAMAAFRQQRLEHDLADAELARSEAALTAGDPAVARRWASVAERRFRRHNNDARAGLAELTRLRARSTAPGGQAPVAAEAARLAERLSGLGLASDAELAELLVVRALLARGDLEEAEAGSRRPGGTGRLRRCRSACCDGWPGPSWPNGTAGRARRWPSCGPAWPRSRPCAADWAASTCRRVPPRWARSWPRPACGWRWNESPRRWSSPGWNAPGPRRSGSGRYSRPPTRRRRRRWPSCVSSAT